MKVVLISLESWDSVWRRNQYLACELVQQNLISHLWFVEPLRRGRPSIEVTPVRPGISAVRVSGPVPKSLGGLALAGRRITRTIASDIDLLWVNDPVLGSHCLGAGVPVVYDVTDDWRSAPFPERITRRIVRAEDRLSDRARTIVCSLTLQRRWRERYGVDAAVVHNGVDADLWRSAVPRVLPGQAPHVGYVGTLHEQRLDLDLLTDLADSPELGTLHLVGPNCLDAAHARRLAQLPKVRVHGPVPATEVPSWMLSMDVLVSPHLVNDFTQSLDAIKAYEYQASGKQVVATPTSGFVASERVRVAAGNTFVSAVADATASTPGGPVESSNTWQQRARQFWAEIERHMSLTRGGN